jgi:hypothetical protein
MKTDTHRIALRASARKAGDTDIVETRDARGDWAIHGKRGSWTVTHVPTGCVGHRARRLRDAQFWMRGAASVHVDPPEGGWVFGRRPEGEVFEAMMACDEAGLQELDKARAPKASPKKHDPDAVPHLCAHRGLVARAIFCRCGSILDCRKSVSIDSSVLCGCRPRGPPVARAHGAHHGRPCLRRRHLASRRRDVRVTLARGSCPVLDKLQTEGD